MSKDDTRPLRHHVLRPHERLADVGGAGGDEPDAGYFVVRDDHADAHGDGDGDGDTDTDTDAHAHAHAHAHADADTDTTIVGTVAVLREAHPSLARPEEQWRLRGMATAEGYRNRGIGAALMTAALAHVADHGGSVVWCNARVPAVAFYRRAGFATIGDPWDQPDIGPHILMWRPSP